MHKKWHIIGILTLLITFTITLTGCLDNNNNNNNGDQTTLPQIDSVGPLYAQWEDWDNDNMNDGLRIGFYFKDKLGFNIEFEDIEVSAMVSLYTQVTNNTTQWVKDRLVYSKTFIFTSSQDTHPLYGTALKIPAGDINVSPGTDYVLGILEVSVTVPTQGDYPLPPDNLIRLYQ
jgi:hypothetical protein